MAKPQLKAEDTEQTTLPVPFEEITEERGIELGPLLYLNQGSLKPYMDHVYKEVMSEVPDVTTAKGRDRIKSLAASVSRSKTLLEKPGRKFLKDLKEQPKIVEGNLREMVTFFDNLRDEVRKPVTDYENEQKAHQEMLQAKVSYFAEEYAGMMENAPNNLTERLQFFERVHAALTAEKVDASYDQYQEAGTAAKAETLDKIELRIAGTKAEIQEQKRLAEEAEQKRQQEIAAAAAKAKADAEAAAQAEIEAANRRAKEAKAQAERDRIEAEQRRIREAEEAKQREAYAAEKARQREEAAAEAERQRIAEEQRKQQAIEAARAADVEHRKAVNNDVLQKLMAEVGVDEDTARLIIIKAAKGNLGALQMNY
jgi:phage-related minor tail protein